jgi:hypothetical protein
MVAARSSIRSFVHAHTCMYRSPGSISQLSSGGRPGHGRCRRDQFAEPQTKHKLDRRIALRTRGLLRQIGESPFPIGSMTVAMSAKRLRHAGAPDERFAKQTQFVVERRCGLRGPEIETTDASGRLALRTSVSKQTHFTFPRPAEFGESSGVEGGGGCGV